MAAGIADRSHDRHAVRGIHEQRNLQQPGGLHRHPVEVDIRRTVDEVETLYRCVRTHREGQGVHRIVGNVDGQWRDGKPQTVRCRSAGLAIHVCEIDTPRTACQRDSGCPVGVGERRRQEETVGGVKVQIQVTVGEQVTDFDEVGVRAVGWQYEAIIVGVVGRNGQPRDIHGIGRNRVNKRWGGQCVVGFEPVGNDWLSKRQRIVADSAVLPLDGDCVRPRDEALKRQEAEAGDARGSLRDEKVTAIVEDELNLVGGDDVVDPDKVVRGTVGDQRELVVIHIPRIGTGGGAVDRQTGQLDQPPQRTIELSRQVEVVVGLEAVRRQWSHRRD